mmetsp:Transcript_6834/g.10347  ORF Transcript_6834/g.10347 Transcript_6834/m.10347 type:complete len:96 (-) Transcript_6834:183-470(-)
MAWSSTGWVHRLPMASTDTHKHQRSQKRLFRGNVSDGTPTHATSLQYLREPFLRFVGLDHSPGVPDIDVREWKQFFRFNRSDETSEISRKSFTAE